MRKSTIAFVLLAAGIAGSASPLLARSNPATALDRAVEAPTRSAANMARDKYRHPKETLNFLGIKPTDTVVEIWPGGGWYTEILAPYLADSGKLIVAPLPGKAAESIATKLGGSPIYAKVVKASFPVLLGGQDIAPGSADAVLTFRNVHNWRMGYQNPTKADYSEQAFRELYAMLKPGGILGIEDHRLPEDADAKRETESGYIKVSTVRALAEKAGFRFAGSSEINANPKDTHDYPKGVWTLPPTFAEKDVDRARYAAIGESDRMTLKFVKPRR